MFGEVLSSSDVVLSSSGVVLSPSGELVYPSGRVLSTQNIHVHLYVLNRHSPRKAYHNALFGMLLAQSSQVLSAPTIHRSQTPARMFTHKRHTR